MIKLMKNKTSGITLIALVVTVIVLLILAGISIVTLSGDHGILKQAGNAKKSTDQAQLEEDIQTAYLRYEQQMKGKNDLEHYLNQIDNVNIEKLAVDTWYVSRGTAEVTIDIEGEKTTGKLVIWDGSKTPKTPELKKDGNIWHWYIYNPDQLKFLAYFVNNGNKLKPDEGETDTENTLDLTQIVIDDGYNPEDVKIIESTTIVYLMNDLDLGARAENNNWETESNEAKKWTPIGIDNSTKKFIGTFEGNNHSIKGVYVNSTKSISGHGLFGNSSTIQNLTIMNSYIKGGTCTGGIVGTLRTGKMNNCHAINCNIEGDAHTGGLLGGALGNVSGCSIYNSKVKGKTSTGGIAGTLQGAGIKIEDCHNKKTSVILKEGTNYMIGGVIGQVTHDTAGIYNCTNTGNVLAYGTYLSNGVSNGQMCGGIVGKLAKSVVISDCSNSGMITGYNEGNRVGGIVGEAGSNSKISECTNSGAVTGSGDSVGGIAGIIFGTVVKCVSTGTVKGREGYVGGIVGDTGSNSTISECTNSGAVTGSAERVGGIVGNASINSTISECTNSGAVTGSGDCVGGVAGVILGTIEKCVNNGIVKQKGGENLGGVVGATGTDCTAKILNCYNIGKIIEESSNVRGVGGIVGWISKTNAKGEVKYNYSIGEIQITGTNVTDIGGAVGHYATTTFEINNNYYELNKSNVTLNNIGEGMSAEDMKKQSFVDLLNAEQSPLVWELGTSNNGYPTLKE